MSFASRRSSACSSIWSPCAPNTGFALVTYIFFLFRLVVAQDQTSFSIFSSPSDIYPLPSSPLCANALAATVQCPDTILSAVPSSDAPISNLTSSDLKGLCTSTCYNSLISSASKVDAACSGWPFILGDTSYVASLPFRYLAYIWSLTCVTQGSQYCVNIAQTSPSSDSGTDITKEPSSVLCQNCTLATMNIQMTSPFGWDANFVSDWQSVQTTCGVSFNNTIPAGLLFDSSTPSASNATSYNVTASPTLPPASANNCVYGTYTIQSGDTCQSIATSHSLSFDQLVAINGLDLACTGLPAPGGKICLSGSCPLYTVKSGDTCVGIYQANNISWTQLIAWNTQLDSYCTNIANQVGKSICIGPPGGVYQSTVTLPPVPGGTPTALAIPAGPIAPGSNRNLCGEWYSVSPGDTCPEILQIYQITNDTFYALNPGLSSDCSDLLSGFEYCVAEFAGATSTTLATPTATGASLISVFDGDFPIGTGVISGTGNMTVTPVTANPAQTYPLTTTPMPTIAPGSIGQDSCLSYYTVQPGDSCLGIEAMFDLSDAELRAWNPEINANCANIQVGLAYCVFGPIVAYTPSIYPSATMSYPSTSLPGSTTVASATATSATATSAAATSAAAPAPTNTASGTITNGCTAYYTIKSGDTCTVVETMFSISLSDFRTWNPEVNAQCTNIVLGSAYCVTGPRSTSNTIAPGTITTGCNSYYTVKSGDTCAIMESQAGATLDQIRQWNPEINSNCANIQPALQYCVSGPAAGAGTITPSQGCTNYYTVQSGDSCPVIESKFSITLAQFLAWNPEINSSCSNILAGVQYCVAGPSSGSPVASSASVAPTGSGTITPGQGCKTYYTVVSGDNCSVIDSKFGITLAQLIRWNPEINASCTNIQLGVQYCVSGP